MLQSEYMTLKEVLLHLPFVKQFNQSAPEHDLDQDVLEARAEHQRGFLQSFDNAEDLINDLES